MTLPLKKLYVDSKYKVEKGNDNSNFTIALHENITFGDNTIMYIDDVTIPHTFWSIEEGYNDKIYMRLNYNGLLTDNILTLTAGNYNPTTFKTELSAQINQGFSNPVHSCEYISLTSSIVLSFSSFSHQIFTDLELQDLQSSALFWNGQAYNTNSLSSANEVLNNRITSEIGTSSNPVSYLLTLNQIRNIYISSSNLSNLSSLGARGERDIIKKVSVTSGTNTMIIDNVHSNADHIDVSNLTLSKIEFSLKDVDGIFIPFHGANSSWTCVFAIMED